MSREVTRLIQLVLSLGFYCAESIWKWGARVTGTIRPGTFLVLYYHAIPASERKRFAQQMDMLLRFAKPIAADCTSAMEAGVQAVAVTFDDGFHSVIANALPELAKRGIPATLFIPTGCLGKEPQWLRDGQHPDYHERIVTSEELRSLVSELVALGSHTVTHPNLITLSEADAKKELDQSRRDLGTLLSTEVNLLSFPYGAYDQKLVELSRQAGYTRVFTTLPTLVEPAEYVVGRVSVRTTDWPLEFFLKLKGAYRWLPYAFTIKRKMRSLMGLGASV